MLGVGVAELGNLGGDAAEIAEGAEATDLGGEFALDLGRASEEVGEAIGASDLGGGEAAGVVGGRGGAAGLEAVEELGIEVNAVAAADGETTGAGVPGEAEAGAARLYRPSMTGFSFRKPPRSPVPAWPMAPVSRGSRTDWSWLTSARPPWNSQRRPRLRVRVRVTLKSSCTKRPW